MKGILVGARACTFLLGYLFLGVFFDVDIYFDHFIASNPPVLSR